MIDCVRCGAATTNPRFCTRSCAAVFNNSTGRTGRPVAKRIDWRCARCNGPAPPERSTCNTCVTHIKANDGSYVDPAVITKGQLVTKDTQKYRRIRDYARRYARPAGVLESCCICGYTLHVECAHIVPIQSYGDDTLIAVINHPSNLCGLCPNHHWEYDNGLLDVQRYLSEHPRRDLHPEPTVRTGT